MVPKLMQCGIKVIHENTKKSKTTFQGPPLDH